MATGDEVASAEESPSSPNGIDVLLKLIEEESAQEEVEDNEETLEGEESKENKEREREIIAKIEAKV